MNFEAIELDVFGDPVLRIRKIGDQVAVGVIDAYGDIPLRHIVRNRALAVQQFYAGNLRQRNSRAGRGRQQQSAERFRAVALVARKPRRQIIDAVFDIDLPDRLTTDAVRHQIGDVGNIEAEAGQSCTVGLDRDLRYRRFLKDGCLGCPLHRPQDRNDRFADPACLFEILADDTQDEGAMCAGYHIVDVVDDRLTDADLVAGQLIEPGTQACDEFTLAFVVRPSVVRTQRHRHFDM